MSAFDTTRLTLNGVETVVLSAGAGEPLVFLHGGGTVEGFDCFLPLAERFRLIAPYHPGFGLSGDDPTISSIGDYVRHYLDLFQVLEVDRLVLVGHSWGGWLATMIATGHPERVRRLILAAPYGLDAPGHPLANIPAMSPDQILASLTRDASVFAGKVPVPLDDAFVAAQARELQSGGRVMPGPYDPALEARLERLTMPTLLLWGDDDKIVPVEHARVWEPLLPNGRSIVFAETGHLLFHENPEAVAAVRDFAEETPY
jgi:pimeloyl-ACP methyl ester carboxylesterase